MNRLPTIEEILATLPPYQDKWVVITTRQSVRDIIRQMCEAHQSTAHYYDNFSMMFYAESPDDIAENIYWFCKDNIKYREEPEESQTSALPTGFLTRGYGDCKHYALFAAGILDSIARLTGMDIKWNYCFASYKEDEKTPYHVFVTVDTMTGPLWIDPTPGSDSQEPCWLLYKCPSVAGRVSSIGRVPAAKMGSIPAPYQNLSASTFNAEVANGTISLDADQVVTALGSNGPATLAAANNFAATCKQITTQSQALYNNNLLTQYYSIVQQTPAGNPNYYPAMANFAFAYAYTSYGWSLNPADGFTSAGAYAWLQINDNAVWQEIYQSTENKISNSLSQIIAANDLKAVKAIPSLLTSIVTGNPAPLIAAALGQTPVVATAVPAAAAPASTAMTGTQWLMIAAGVVGIILLISNE